MDKLYKIINSSIMIEFERTNEKGDRVTAYTHKNYLSTHYNSEI